MTRPLKKKTKLSFLCNKEVDESFCTCKYIITTNVFISAVSENSILSLVRIQTALFLASYFRYALIARFVGFIAFLSFKLNGKEMTNISSLLKLYIINVRNLF